MLEIVYAHLQSRKPIEDWVYEALYYIDELIEKAKIANSTRASAGSNDGDLKIKKTAESSLQQLSAEDKKELLEVIVV